jgi:antibiotic biosynthesis monooxygenase (ABM) superfamily enzyme
MNDEQAALTKVIDRIPRPGMEQQLEEAIKALNAAARQSAGFVGVNITRPSLPLQSGFRVIYKFASLDALKGWEESDETPSACQ